MNNVYAGDVMYVPLIGCVVKILGGNDEDITYKILESFSTTNKVGVISSVKTDFARGPEFLFLEDIHGSI